MDVFEQMDKLLSGGGRMRPVRVNNNTRHHNDKSDPRAVTRAQVERVHTLLDNVHIDIKRKFQFDAEASWSITNLRIAREFAVTLAGFTGDNVTLTDAMACVGGNTIAFAEVYKHVNAIELNGPRSRMLSANLKLFALTNVSVYNGDARAYIPQLTQDVIFFDPPWGTDYKKHPHGTMKIWLGDELFDDIAAASCKYAKFIAIKLPVNYAVEDLVATMLPATEIHRETHSKPNTSLVIVFKV